MLEDSLHMKRGRGEKLFTLSFQLFAILFKHFVCVCVCMYFSLLYSMLSHVACFKHGCWGVGPIRKQWIAYPKNLFHAKDSASTNASLKLIHKSSSFSSGTITESCNCIKTKENLNSILVLIHGLLEDILAA